MKDWSMLLTGLGIGVLIGLLMGRDYTLREAYKLGHAEYRLGVLEWRVHEDE